MAGKGLTTNVMAKRRDGGRLTPNLAKFADGLNMPGEGKRPRADTGKRPTGPAADVDRLARENMRLRLMVADRDRLLRMNGIDTTNLSTLENEG